MKIAEIKERRKSVCGLLFEEEIDPAEYGADIDAAGWLSLDSELCAAEHLKAGMELSEDELLGLVNKSHIKRAKSRAMWYISRSDCPKRKLMEKLTMAFPDYAAAAAADRMEELGLIDDERYAKRRMQIILSEKKVSVRLARRLLEAEGVDREIAEVVAEEAEYDPTSAIVALIERKYKNKLSDKKELDLTVAALMRKGYSYSEIREALKEFELRTDYYEDSI